MKKENKYEQKKRTNMNKKLTTNRWNMIKMWKDDINKQRQQSVKCTFQQNMNKA